MHPSPLRPAQLLTLSTLTLALAACSADCNDDVELLVTAPATGLADAPVQVTIRFSDPGEGCSLNTAAGDIAVEVAAGGGSAPGAATHGVPFQWKLGPAPVRQALRVRPKVGGGSAEPTTVEVIATRDAPIAATPYADVNAWMVAEKVKGSTEDLALTPKDDAWVMGIPGGLIEVDPEGKVTRRETTGDALVAPLGVAFDRAGQLWVADGKGAALRKVAVDGAVTTPLTADDGTDLQGPNYVAIDRQDRVLLTDPCIGRLMRFDPKAGKVDARESFDLLTEGGPNGVALDAEGKWLYILTENTALLCPKSKPKPDLQAPIAGLFRLALEADGFGPRETVQAGIGVFGDGLAFDVQGNLYVIGDAVESFALKESFIAVLREGGGELVPFVSAKKRVFANVAFGRGAFGSTTLYIALLAVPPFTDNETRGLMKVDVGIAGLPLL